MEVRLRNVRIRARHGLLPHERTIGNDFEVNLRAVYPLPAGEPVPDRIESTLCYAAIFNIVSEQMAIPSALLEHVAWRIGDTLRSRWPELTLIEVEITKISPPIAGFQGSASVAWRWEKEGDKD